MRLGDKEERTKGRRHGGGRQRGRKKTWAMWSHGSQEKQAFPGGRSNQLDPRLPIGQ